MSTSDVVIRVEGLGKKYSLHHEKAERYMALRDVFARQAKVAGKMLNPFTLAGQLRRAQRQAVQERAEGDEEFWALRDVSFEIRRGERVGIIGRNGAGKSTLLKILSRITEPTTGRVEILGRVASLLEVGTGFHPELTGRENIYLNGSILGMTRRDIRSKFDEIVDFAEVAKFLDTPVKRYSSGMYVRLAFAVAAHLEPEILVVDEVLAVGDASFQKKCMGRMKDVTEQGKTVLFVSHNMGAIEAMCDKGILMQKGNIASCGPIHKVSETYAVASGNQIAKNFSNLSDHPRNAKYSKKLLTGLALEINSRPVHEVPMGHAFQIIINIDSPEPIINPRIGISIDDMHGTRVLNLSPSHQSPDALPNSLSKGSVTCYVQSLPLIQGMYAISLILAGSHDDLDRVENALYFTISSHDVFGTGQIPTRDHGIAFAMATWRWLG